MKRRVLIIDDDRWFVESIGRGLRKNFRVASVDVVESAFPAIEKFKPDFLLLDLVLGNKNAVTFLNEFISYDDLDNVKVVILSSVTRDVSRDSLLRLGAIEVLDKAEITPELLRQTLESLR